MVTPELFDNEWKNGDRTVAMRMAESFVEDNPDIYAEFGEFSIEDLVQAVSTFRRMGMERYRIIVDMYLMAQHSSRQIVGQASIQLDASQMVKLAEEFILANKGSV
jgi:hypothetical protein